MANPVFPTLTSSFGEKPDSSKFEIEVQDNALRQEIEGGYVITRPRTTRKARMLFKVSYTAISDEDKALLLDFYKDVFGGSVMFEWTSPDDGVEYIVRFKGPLRLKYVGIGPTKLWDCGFELEQV